jgi:hypothetical protein
MPLPRRLLAGIAAISIAVGLAGAALDTGVVELQPPRVGSSDLAISTAATHYLVDSPGLSIINRRSPPVDIAIAVRRAELLGRLTASRPVVERIARHAGVAADRVSAFARVTASVPSNLLEPNSERRASDIAESRQPYRIEVQTRQTTPILDVYVQAPTTAEAARLANGVGPGLLDQLRAVARAEGDGESPTRLRQLGAPRAGVANTGTTLGVFLITFIVGFALCFGALFAVAMLLRGPAEGSLAARDSADPEGGGDWPHTGRVLPWTFAIFLAVVWLVPFTQIQLDVPSPVDLTLDRLVLPLVIGAWLVALIVGGRAALRLRLTWTHVALAGFVACAFLSVALSASYLNGTGELDLLMKKLPLLVSYALVFVVAASAVRVREVPAFLTYTLGLAVVCAVGIVWEYRFNTNLFFTVANAVLPGNFDIASYNDALDHLGRRSVRGPADVSLEAVTMLSLALPIALIRFVDTRAWGRRALYGLAACALLAAIIATNRKSALLAPAAVFVTLACFRPRELLRLAPLGVVLFGLVHVLSPGALGATVSQLVRSDRGTVPTVSDRVADYDAIRPDLWTHFAFGRGFGSYDHATYRILDSEILHRIVETGVLGLVAFLLIPIAVIASSRRAIADRDPHSAPTALVGAAAGACFLVVSLLYDVLSFPHAVYVFLYIAGLAAAVTRTPGERAATAGATTRGRRPTAHPARHGAPGARRPAPRPAGRPRTRA